MMGILKEEGRESRGPEEPDLAVAGDIIPWEKEREKQVVWGVAVVRIVRVSFGTWSFLWSSHVGSYSAQWV